MHGKYETDKERGWGLKLNQLLKKDDHSYLSHKTRPILLSSDNTLDNIIRR